ncbi:hypothetical protein CI105_09185 [Candidatus Izimaplasma bacterium ZiA1]|uniref:hypothetical protein n=1 Tax=Candidatus Izimoplasma sp. ZiA1 TaxID=2024899 RepID=UPI000BAA5CDD|nr:hypothetical protein CI105_09185 [Candidatus Izimaplasma bacterium ZiA1]
MDVHELMKSAKKGDKEARLEVSLLVIENSNKEYEKYMDYAWKQLKKFARKGNKKALIALAKYYLRNDFVSPANMYCIKLIKMGVPEGQELLDESNKKVDEKERTFKALYALNKMDSKSKYETILDGFDLLSLSVAKKIKILEKALYYGLKKAYIYLGVIEYERGNLDKALSYFEQSKKSDFTEIAKKAFLEITGSLPEGLRLNTKSKINNATSFDFESNRYFLHRLFIPVTKVHKEMHNYLKLQSIKYKCEEPLEVDVTYEVTVGVMSFQEVTCNFSYEDEPNSFDYTAAGKIRTNYDSVVKKDDISKTEYCRKNYSNVVSHIPIISEKKLADVMEYYGSYRIDKKYLDSDLSVKISFSQMNKIKKDMKKEIIKKYNKSFRAKPSINSFKTAKIKDEIVWLIKPIYTISYQNIRNEVSSIKIDCENF